MGWRVGEELTKSWPTFEQFCVQNLALAISCHFLLPRVCTKSGWLEVDQELDMGCQLLTRTFPCWNCTGLSLKTLTSLNKEVRPFFLGDNSIWIFPSVSSLSDYSIWRSWGLFWPCDHSIWSIWVRCPQILLSLRRKGLEESRLLNLRRLRSSRFLQ